MARVALGTVAVVIVALLVAGCGGGGGSATTGAFSGYVYVTSVGNSYDISDITPAPTGSAAVPGADVSVTGVPGAQTTTDNSGQYLITGIPPGDQTLDVTVQGNVVVSAVVTAVAGTTTVGHGHSQGGG